MTPPRHWRDVAAGYDEGAAGYDARHSSARDLERQRLIEAPLLDAARGARRVLELGVGTGRLLSRVDAGFCTGIDVSAAMLAQAARKGIEVVRADAHRLPFATGSFDAVIAAGAVFRYLDTAAALQEAARVVVSGGRLAIHQLGARTWTIRGRRSADPRVRELESLDELVTPARTAGFAIDRIVRWRTLRWFPYLFEIPAWMDGASPVQLWSHVVVVMHRA